MPKIVDHNQQRQLLSATVADVVARSGLENATLRNVAASHGCTKGMVQHYFADKDELLLAALGYVEDQCNQRLPAADSGLTGLAWLQAQLLAQLPLTKPLLRECQVRLAFSAQAAHSAGIRKILVQSQGNYQTLGIKGLRQAQRSGELKAGLSQRDAYRSLAALVWGVGLAAVRDYPQWPAAAQRQVVKRAIDNLRS